jgi:hypothetical protein
MGTTSDPRFSGCCSPLRFVCLTDFILQDKCLNRSIPALMHSWCCRLRRPIVMWGWRPWTKWIRLPIDVSNFTFAIILLQSSNSPKHEMFLYAVNCGSEMEFLAERSRVLDDWLRLILRSAYQQQPWLVHNLFSTIHVLKLSFCYNTKAQRRLACCKNEV